MAPPAGHQSKKRRIDGKGGFSGDPVGTSSALPRFKPREPRDWTVSVAVPTSIIADCLMKEQRTVNAGRVARALAVFSIDEIVIFDDSPPASRPAEVDHEAYTGDTDPAHFLTHLLSYLETPPFMRKTLFSLHPNLRTQSLVPNLDMPHHPYKDEWMPYREGITIEATPDSGEGTMVDIGMSDPVRIAESIPPKTRVTLRFPDRMTSEGTPPVAVHPDRPRTESGYYWGYSVRQCGSLSAVFTDSPFEDGYDVSIGTSERGVPLARAFPFTEQQPRRFNHFLVIFGGPRGLEYAAMNDPELVQMNIAGARTRELFDYWVNVLPHQGSRGIRTDEAMLIALAGLRRLWDDMS